MSNIKKINSALISVFNKDGIDKIIFALQKNDIKIYSTGGTKKYIENLGVNVNTVEDLTSYPSILGGRVKTLHPKVFGGILARRDSNDDKKNLIEYDIPEIDLVIVDLYPFENTVASGANHNDIIEKIDIGGISLIRAAAKNYNDVVIIPSKNQYNDLLNILEENNAETNLEQRQKFALQAFNVSSHYDMAIFNYFDKQKTSAFKQSIVNSMHLRYGENPHQEAKFFGNFNDIFEQLHGKEISYNNLLDIDSAVSLINDFDELTVAILKHTNACGLASRNNLLQAWKDALAGDPLSAFGGIIVTNTEIDEETAVEIDKIFSEVIIAPSYTQKALDIFKKKKNRRILIQKTKIKDAKQFRTILNGVLYQDKDLKIETHNDFNYVTDKKPSKQEIDDLIFANKIVKHSKSNAIVLAKNKQLIASGVGQTSRIDALKHAIEKAKNFNFNLNGAVMSSDAFFPFADSVEIANAQGIKAVIQPGGSVRDKDSIDYCNKNNMSMVFTGIRHFKH